MDLGLSYTIFFENRTRDVEFDIFDNDYIEVFTIDWDTGLNRKEGRSRFYLRPGPELDRCAQDRLDKLVIPEDQAIQSNNTLCLKDLNETQMYGDYVKRDGRLATINIGACDTRKRSTCKPRQEIAAFFERSFFSLISLKSVVAED